MKSVSTVCFLTSEDNLALHYQQPQLELRRPNSVHKGGAETYGLDLYDSNAVVFALKKISELAKMLKGSRLRSSNRRTLMKARQNNRTLFVR